MRSNAEEIAGAIRERICLDTTRDPVVLHESELALEFGVSRTPIRQVLQMLAYEGLVVTRSGVGTIVTPLERGERARDERAFRAILRAAAQCTDPGPMPRAALEPLVQAHRLATHHPDREAFFRANARLLQVSTRLVADRIVEAGLAAAYWRHIRWQMRDEIHNCDEKLRDFADLLEQLIAAARNGDPIGLMSLLAERI